MKEPCIICGEIEPKGWEQLGVGSWAGHWDNCPRCGHLKLYTNFCYYDDEARTSSSRGAPKWVYRMYDELNMIRKCLV